jgi:hypothetical protein
MNYIYRAKIELAGPRSLVATSRYWLATYDLNVAIGLLGSFGVGSLQEWCATLLGRSQLERLPF